jgi:hypothetical protein
MEPQPFSQFKHALLGLVWHLSILQALAEKMEKDFDHFSFT